MGAPNVYDTSYVNSGPGVSLGSYSGHESGESKHIDYYNENHSDPDVTLANLASSVYGLSRTSPAADFIRENLDNPNNSAYMSSLYNNFAANQGTSYDMDEYFDKIESMSDKNNKWSADQAKSMMEFQNQSNANAMAWSASEAQKTRDWQEKLSNTAHQREMRDLVSAGLNPILAANNGAYTGSGATGQSFSSSGAMGNTDTGNTAAISSLLNNVITTARDIAITKMQVASSKYNADANYASSKLAAGASIYNNNNNVSANKAMSELNRQADLTKAGMSADATRAAAAMSAGAITSAAYTNAQAAKYTADQHTEQARINYEASKYHSDKSYDASVYGSNQSAEASKYGSTKSYESSMYGHTHDLIKNPTDFGYNTGRFFGEELKSIYNGFNEFLNGGYKSDYSPGNSGRKF